MGISIEMMRHLRDSIIFMMGIPKITRWHLPLKQQQSGFTTWNATKHIVWWCIYMHHQTMCLVAYAYICITEQGYHWFTKWFGTYLADIMCHLSCVSHFFQCGKYCIDEVMQRLRYSFVACYISMGLCMKDIIPLLMHWRYIFLALTQGMMKNKEWSGRAMSVKCWLIPCTIAW